MERRGVADLETQRPLLRALGNLQLEAPRNPPAAIGPQEDLAPYLVARPNFAFFERRLLDHQQPPFRQQFDRDVYPFERRQLLDVRQEPLKLVPDPAGQCQRRGDGGIGGGPHGLERNAMIAEVNVSLQTERRLLREVVEAEHRVVDGEDHQGRRPTLVLEDVVVELLFLDHGVLAVKGADLHVDGDHRGAFPEDAHDARVTVLPQRSHDVG